MFCAQRCSALRYADLSGLFFGGEFYAEKAGVVGHLEVWIEVAGPALQAAFAVQGAGHAVPDGGRAVLLGHGEEADRAVAGAEVVEVLAEVGVRAGVEKLGARGAEDLLELLGE